MRLKLLVCGLTTLVPALLLAGCGVDQTNGVLPNVQSAGVSGRAYGGQQPVVGATVEVVAMGTSGYGSAGTVLSSGTTGPNGDFDIPSYTCPQSNTPVYLLGIGGNAGDGTNASAVEAAALGPCASAQKSYVIMNEITTAATAFVFSHFFPTTLGGTDAANDTIGGPSSTSGGTVTYSVGLTMANNYTYPTIVANNMGYPIEGSNGTTVEYQKILTIADILAACINSSGAKSTTETQTNCGKLFKYTQNGATTRPSDTLQAAVQMALNPTTDVTSLYNLGTTTPPFPNYLTSAPNDWTIGVSFTTAALGLAVDAGTVSTLDIDSSGKIWFPSNASGKAGAAYFDPTTQTFSGPFNTTGLVHPQQVAIDANGYVWLNDSANSTLPGYLTTSPTLTEAKSLTGTQSNALTVGGDDRINVAVTRSGTYETANVSADRSTYTLSGAKFSVPGASMAGDNKDGDALTDVDTSTNRMHYDYVDTTPTATQLGSANDDSGQVIFTGNDYIAVRSYSGGTNAKDGLCIYSSTCYIFKGGLQNQAEGIVIDGGGQLWVAEAGDQGILQVPVNSPAASGSGAVYLNPSGATNIPFNQFLHGPAAVGGGTATAPFGIGVDVAGNVWVTNAGCNTTDCAPSGNFTLTEIIGAAYPTITPVSAQITSGTNLVGTEPTY